jgi:DNA-binding transcriptional MerR regulator
MSMTQQLYLISDVSRMLGVPAHRIAYLFMTRKLAEPELRLGNRRVFSRSDVQRVAEALGRPIGEQEGR